jgi:rfaE bifunctional protein kinase chain/domain
MKIPETVNEIFDSFNKLKVLIIGDVMIDAYLFGGVERISPEAPVPVVSVERKEKRLGGAANVALNIQALGATPILCSIVGEDEEGHEFLKILTERGISNEGILLSPGRITTVKTRVIGNNHQMLRVDSEMTNSVSDADAARFIEKIESFLPVVDVVIFEDYDKGVLTPSIIGQVIGKAKRHKVPTAVDPKRRNFLAYREATLFKPNTKELKEGLKLDYDLYDLDNLQKAVSQLRELMGIDMAMVTLSERGVYITNGTQSDHIYAHIRQIADVSGAGDTVISVAALCLALGLPQTKIAGLSNLAGGLVCEKVGVVPIDKIQLKAEAEELGI